MSPSVCITGYFHALRCHLNKESKTGWKSVSVCPYSDILHPENNTRICMKADQFLHLRNEHEPQEEWKKQTNKTAVHI